MITHGKDGWRLSKYDWDEETGWATLVWTRTQPGGERERHEEQRFQPAYPSHRKQQAEAEAIVAAARASGYAKRGAA